MGKLEKFSKLIRSKKTLLVCIFLTLMFQILVSYITMKLDQKHDLLGETLKNTWSSFVLLFLMIGLIFMMKNRKYPFAVQQGFFVLFSVLIGLMLSAVIHTIKDKHIVEASVIATLLNFIAFLILGFIIVYFGYNLDWLGIVLFISLVGLIISRFFLIFVPDNNEYKKMSSYLSIFAVIVFSLYILYDTNIILLRYKNKDKTDCISGALDYYLDIVNLFTSYLDIKS